MSNGHLPNSLKLGSADRQLQYGCTGGHEGCTRVMVLEIEIGMTLYHKFLRVNLAGCMTLQPEITAAQGTAKPASARPS